MRAVLRDPVPSTLRRSDLVRLLLTAAAGLQNGWGLPETTVPGSGPATSEVTISARSGRWTPGRPVLSHREREVLRLYASNLPSTSVARQLGITEGSVKEYLKRVRRKYQQLGLAAGTKRDLYHRAREDGLVPGRHALGVHQPALGEDARSARSSPDR